MKQKITIKMSMICDKSRREAMKTASKQDGVLSIELQGEDKLVVTGDGVDAVELTKSLRKKVGCSTLISVEEVKEKKEEKKEEKKKEPEKDCPKICCDPCDRICPKPCYVPVSYCEYYEPSPSPCCIM